MSSSSSTATSISQCSHNRRNTSLFWVVSLSLVILLAKSIVITGSSSVRGNNNYNQLELPQPLQQSPTVTTRWLSFADRTASDYVPPDDDSTKKGGDDDDDDDDDNSSSSASSSSLSGDMSPGVQPSSTKVDANSYAQVSQQANASLPVAWNYNRTADGDSGNVTSTSTSPVDVVPHWYAYVSGGFAVLALLFCGAACIRRHQRRAQYEAIPSSLIV